MPRLMGPVDIREWCRFLRATRTRWKGYPLLREMDAETFDAYSDESRTVQEALSYMASTPSLAAPFLSRVSPDLLDLIVRMYFMGDDITAFLLARSLGGLQEELGLQEEAARTLQFAGRCARVLRLYDEGLLLLDRARDCAVRVHPDHPLLTEFHNLRGLVCHFTNRLDEAESHYLQSLALLDVWPAEAFRRHTGRTKSRLRGLRLTNLLDLHLVRARRVHGREKAEEIEKARGLQREVLDRARREPTVLGLNEANEAEILMVEGRLPEARALLLASIGRCARDSQAASHALPPMNRLLAKIAAEDGDAHEAYARCREGLSLSLDYANSLEEGLIVETTIEIMGRFMRPRVAGSGLSALCEEDHQVIQNLVLLLESKDWYTGNNHSRAVSRLCKALGERLCNNGHSADDDGQDAVHLDTLELAGLLHDIGKLRIPWSLLNKRNPLVEFEYQVLRSHVSEGTTMLRLLGFEELARLVAEHHEKLDGSGYPEGRRELTLMGAVIAVSDCYEAMITPNRRYTQPKHQSLAISELQGLVGAHYDPRVVSALSQLVARTESVSVS